MATILIAVLLVVISVAISSICLNCFLLGALHEKDNRALVQPEHDTDRDLMGLLAVPPPMMEEL